MIVCHSCYQKNSLITHGNHDVIDEDAPELEQEWNKITKLVNLNLFNYGRIM